MRCAVKRSGGENARSLKYDGRPYCFVPECDWGLIVAKAWGGRFDGKTDPRVEKFTESISFDSRLAAVDIQGSQAHARMLAHVGLLTRDECDSICSTLDVIGEEIASGQFELKIELEDIHMHVESALIARLGDVGRKLHTGRSRNDQVATDLKLYVRDAIDEIDRQLAALQSAFVERSLGDLDVIVPGYTHLQRAQPVLVVHYWLAYCEKFERDRQRLADCCKRVKISPLGAAALAGTSLPIDREYSARLLGFTAPAGNSLDVPATAISSSNLSAAWRSSRHISVPGPKNGYCGVRPNLVI